MGKYRNTSKAVSTAGKARNAVKKRRKSKSSRNSWWKFKFSRKSWLWWYILWLAEAGGTIVTCLIFVPFLLGLASRNFAGTHLLNNILPFLLSFFAVSIGLSLAILCWWQLRKKLISYSVFLTPLLASAMAVVSIFFASQESFHLAYTHLKTMVGGRVEANRITLKHQIYAAYRRHSITQLKTMVKRAEPYSDDIYAAAKVFSLDPDLLFGLAAAESSFYPRKSSDGGVGLFQITSVPYEVEKQVASLLNQGNPAVNKHRRNSFLAAATLSNYLAQMGGDHLLGLLAYNIGPANGGLRSIMKQYKVTDFTSIQPYLQSGPRNYPIRVLSYALAFRMWHRDGAFLAYEKGSNAIRIQKMGIPGIDSR